MNLIKKCLCLLLVLTTVVSVMSLGFSGLVVHAASADSYISATYAANLSVKTEKATNLMSLPTTASDSQVKYTIPSDTMLFVKALYKNTSGEYWYKVLYYGLTLYVNGADTIMVDHLTGDISAKNMQSPAALQYNTGFPIGGEISSSLNDIGRISASMYKGSNLHREPALTSSDTVNGKYYNLTNSTVDTNLWFNKLSAGVYSYVVTAEAVSYYIDSNDSLKTSVVEVQVENKMCAVTNNSSPNPVLHKGIDVSVWNGDVNWPTVATQVEFVIMRASWEETADTKFYTNAKGCQDNNIPFGVYVYSYAETEAEAIGEAEYVLSIVDGYDLSLPIYFDFEDECQMSLDSSLQKKIVKAFCDTIYAAGYQPGIYTYKWVLTSVLTDAYFKTLPTWVAEINGASYTSYAGGLTMWQYSWVGSFSGMSGDVDCNYMYTELPGTGSSDTSYLKSCTYYPSNLRVTLNANVNMREYPASTHTLLNTISSGTELHVTGLYKNTYGNYWYEVEYNGQSGYIASEYADIKEYLFDDISIQNPDMASNLNSGNGYYIGGDLGSIYNNLTTVNTKVYSGEDTTAEPVLKSSYSPNSKTYSLYKSEVDYGLVFGNQPSGYYTYEISADIKNYSASGTALSSKTENVVVWTKPYTVNNAAIVPPENAVCTHTVVIQEAVAPTCTETGLTEGSYCKDCGEIFKEQETVEATGHSYEAKSSDATCVDYGYTVYTCTLCGDNYTEIANAVYSDWQENYPQGIDEDEIQTKIQYRFADFETIKNNQPTVEGYTAVGKEWISQGQNTVEYVKSWPSGFDKSHSLYGQYNKTAVNNYEDETGKATVNSEELTGYLYYHWCSNQYSDGPYNRTTSKEKTDYYVGFHAFYSTKAPSESERTADDGSVIYSNLSCCGDTYWYYNVPVYKQTSTSYKAQYTHEGWTEWSEWSDSEYKATETRKVETRNIYRYVVSGGLGEHNFVNGVCSVCGEPKPPQDMYLFGYINGADYGYNTDESNIGTYKFKEGTLVTTFTQDSYVGVKTEDNLLWYMTNGEQGKVTTVNLFNTKVLGDKANLLFVPAGREVTFTLKDNGNDSFILSYTLAPCSHENHSTDGRCTVCSVLVEHTYENGICTICGNKCGHSFVNGVCVNCSLRCSHEEYTDGVCSLCSMACKHSFAEGKCTVCGFACEHSFKDGVCTICKTVCEHSFEDGVCITCSKVCEHTWQSGICIVCGVNCEHNFQNAGCTICGVSCEHSFEDSECTKCGEVCELHRYSEGYCLICGKTEPTYYLFGYINGADYACNADYENIGVYKFVDGTLKAKFTEDSYVAVKTWDNSEWYMTNGYPGNNVTLAVLYNTELLGTRADKLFVPKGREITFNLTDNGDDTLTLMYTVAPCEHLSHSTEGVCSDCSAKISHSFSGTGICTVCGYACQHSFKEGICTNCAVVCRHNFKDGVCTICSKTCSHSFKNGVCVICDTACEHTFSGGECTNCGYICNHSFKEGKCTVCGYVCEHSFADGECTVCGNKCEHSFENGICTKCESLCNHSINGGECTVCHKQYTYNLVGFINGKNTGSEENFEQTGEYVFENMKLSLTTTEDSFVFIKSDDNENWYMAQGGESAETTLYNIKDTDAQNMFYIPGGVEAELALRFGENDTLVLSYSIISCNHLKLGADSSCKVCGYKEPIPEFALKYSSFCFEEDLRYSVYFKAENMDGVSASDMGLAIFAEENADGTIDAASEVISGVKESDGYLVATTNRVMAYELGDTVYFKIYAKLSDGTYIYSNLLSYSALRYAQMVLDNPNSKKEEKALMVALLNYGAEMQKLNDYKTNELVNRSLTKEQKALVKDYSPDMADKTKTVPKDKIGEFAKTGKGVMVYPEIMLDTDLFGIDFKFKAKDISGDVYVYCWDEAAYEAVDVLTKDNALFKVKLSEVEGFFTVYIYDFYAKDFDSPVYVSFVYETEAGSRSSGVIAYSLADYYNVQASNEKSEINSLAKAAVVYGYYAKNFFKK